MKRKFIALITAFLFSCTVTYPAPALEERVVDGKNIYIFTESDIESQARIMDGLIKTNQGLADEVQRLGKIVDSYEAVCKVRNERYLK